MQRVITQFIGVVELRRARRENITKNTVNLEVELFRHTQFFLSIPALAARAVTIPLLIVVTEASDILQVMSLLVALLEVTFAVSCNMDFTVRSAEVGVSVTPVTGTAKVDQL